VSWFFRKKEKNPDREALERFHTDFGLFRENRFPPVEEATYACRVKHGALTMEIRKKNHFAWVPSRLFQYRNFHLEASLSFDKENGHSAGGFVFRFVNNENFYYFLVSNSGAFRCDVLFNGHPLRLIEWTPTPLLDGDRHEISIIAHGEHFSFYAGHEWLGEIDDDKLYAGRIGLAGQNFNEEKIAVWRVHRLLLDSRPVAVETAYWRWTRYVPVDAFSRVALGRTLSTMGNYSAAAVQLKKALKHDPENREALFLFALCAVNLKVFDQALEALDKVLEQDPGHREAVVEKANALYLSNDFLRARDFIRSHPEALEASSTLWNLLGNCEHALGNREQAAEAYGKAGLLDPSMPLFPSNRARMLEQDGKTREALEEYLKAARLLFREEAYNDLSLILPRIAELNPENDEVLGFEAKMLFHENRRTEARPILEKLIAAGSADSALYYLSALIAIDEGQRETAAARLERAVALAPDYALYWWRLAELKRSLGRDYGANLEKAAGLAPDDPWVNNLRGLEALDRADENAALGFFTRAQAGAEHDIDILINLSEMLFRTGKKAEARGLIDGELARGEDARLYNHKGNLAVQEGNFDLAVAEYERAVRLAPGNQVYMENCAAACLETEKITRAEELLVKVLDGRPTASAYNLLGNLCVLRTEFLRAEYCYAEGLRLEPRHRELRFNLAGLYIERSQYEKAKELLTAFLEEEPSDERVLRLRQKLKDRFEIRLACSQCGREWWVYRDIPLMETGKIRGEPPPESPAGRCPACGNIYCIECARTHLVERRFACASCGEFLKLSDNYLRHLVMVFLESETKKSLPSRPESSGSGAPVPS
jgi:tetratricopeptide (TPR) repeat protein